MQLNKKVVLFGNLQNEQWRSPSMDRVSREIFAALKNKKVNVELVEPIMPFYISVLPAKWRFGYARFSYYPNLAKETKADVYHITDHSYGQLAKSLDPERTIITCHDLIPLTYEKDSFASNSFKKSVSYLHLAKIVLADSAATKKDLVNQLKLNPDKVKVVYLGRDEKFKPLSGGEVDQFKQKYQLPDKPLLLHVGNNLPYKNIENLLRSLQILKNKGLDFQFLKVGSCFTTSQKKLINELGLTFSVQNFPSMPETDLPALYNSCSALVYPSLLEGFGFPTLEALSCGLLTVVSKGSSLEEIAAEAGLYVNPVSPVSIAAGVEKALVLASEEKEKLQRLGLARSQQFSWDKTAEELIKIYELI